MQKDKFMYVNQSAENTILTSRFYVITEDNI